VQFVCTSAESLMAVQILPSECSLAWRARILDLAFLIKAQDESSSHWQIERVFWYQITVLHHTGWYGIVRIVRGPRRENRRAAGCESLFYLILLCSKITSFISRFRLDCDVRTCWETNRGQRTRIWLQNAVNSQKKNWDVTREVLSDVEIRGRCLWN
jgi:hypothetical protein